jgi:hypothetical protein
MRIFADNSFEENDYENIYIDLMQGVQRLKSKQPIDLSIEI